MVNATSLRVRIREIVNNEKSMTTNTRKSTAKNILRY